MANIIDIGGGAGGSGTSVIPNPQGTATDTLVKLGINGTIYDFAGGSGSGYTETTLWSGSTTPTTSGSTINLSDNISNYDEIVFIMTQDYNGASGFLVSSLTIGGSYISTVYSHTSFGAYWDYDSANSITIYSQASAHLVTYTEVVGIKYGGGSAGHNYSTTEQVVGTWLDGSTLYEKTITINSLVSGSYQTVSHGITNPDVIFVKEGFALYTPTGTSNLTSAIVSSYHSTVGGEQFLGAVSHNDFGYRCGSELNGSIAYITIRYTKSSS